MIPLIPLIENELRKISPDEPNKSILLRLAIWKWMALDAKILEIGAGHRSVFRKSEFKNLKVYDYYSTEELFEHFKKDYKLNDINITEFSEVDYVCKDGDMVRAVNGNKFDVIYSSHSIEHQPDVITFLQNVSEILEDDGVVILVIPDKRSTFDALRNTSSTGELLRAYKEKRSMPDPETIFDTYSRTITENSLKCVKSGDSIHFSSTIDDAINIFNKYYDSNNEYIDTHNFVFTPESYCINMIELYMTKIIDLFCSYCSDPFDYEFVSILSKVPHQIDEGKEQEMTSVLNSMRMDLYKKLFLPD